MQQQALEEVTEVTGRRVGKRGEGRNSWRKLLDDQGRGGKYVGVLDWSNGRSNYFGYYLFLRHFNTYTHEFKAICRIERGTIRGKI